MKATLLSLLTLSLLTALVYFLIGAGVLQPGDLQADEAPAGIAYFAGACYVVGGLLILANPSLARLSMARSMRMP